MKKLLLFSLLFGTMGYAQVSIPALPDTAICDEDNDGFAMFDLTVYENMILGDLNPNYYTVRFHETAEDANEGVNMIMSPETYSNITPFEQTMYVRLYEDNNPDNYDVAQFSLIVVPIPSPNLVSGSICSGPDGTIPYILDTGLNNEDYDFSWTCNGMPLQGNQSSISATTAGIYEVYITTNGIISCSSLHSVLVNVSGTASAIGTGYTVNGQDITITVEGAGYYQYQLDNGEAQESNIFTNLSLGMHTVYVHDLNGCGTLSITLSIPPAPTGQAEQTFNEGETLADIEVEGENIQWYETEVGDTPLSMATVLVDGTTYHAAQSIEGAESAQRLAVTVNLTAGLNETILAGLKYYPNPVVGILTLENTNGIDTISIINTLGQTIKKQPVNSNNTQVDVTSLSNGVYFVTVTSGSASKTIKIVKE